MRDCSDSGEEQIVLEPEDVKVTAEFIKKDNDVSMQGQCRQFVFAEFLAGMGGLSEAEVHIRREDFHWQTKIYKAATGLCATEIDHGHFAPPCRTLTRARSSDEFGQVPYQC